MKMILYIYLSSVNYHSEALPMCTLPITDMSPQSVANSLWALTEILTASDSGSGTQESGSGAQDFHTSLTLNDDQSEEIKCLCQSWLERACLITVPHLHSYPARSLAVASWALAKMKVHEGNHQNHYGIESFRLNPSLRPSPCFTPFCSLFLPPPGSPPSSPPPYRCSEHSPPMTSPTWPGPPRCGKGCS